VSFDHLSEMWESRTTDGDLDGLGSFRGHLPALQCQSEADLLGQLPAALCLDDPGNLGGNPVDSGRRRLAVGSCGLDRNLFCQLRASDDSLHSPSAQDLRLADAWFGSSSVKLILAQRQTHSLLQTGYNQWICPGTLARSSRRILMRPRRHRVLALLGKEPQKRESVPAPAGTPRSPRNSGGLGVSCDPVCRASAGRCGGWTGSTCVRAARVRGP